MINKIAEFRRHGSPFTHHTMESVIAPADLARLTARPPARELYRRLVKEGPRHVKNYRVWLLVLFEHGERTAAARHLPPAWAELLDSLLSPDLATWASDGLDRDLTTFPMTVGLFRYGDGDHQTVGTGKASKAVHWVLHVSDGWSPGFGGELHLWRAGDDTVPARSIPPLGGTSVLFTPHDATWHSIGEVTSGSRYERLTIVLEYWQA